MPDAVLPTTAVLLTYDALLEVKAELARLRETAGPAATRPDDPSSALVDPTERMTFLEEALARTVVAHPGADGGYAVAAVGTTVEVDDGRRTSRYRIVLGVEPADRGTGRAVSATSPVGAALLGRAVGDLATVALPDGRERRLRVLDIAAA